MKYINRALAAFLQFFLVFTGLLTILFIYQIQAVQHGLLSVMAAGGVTPDVLIFNSLATIPIAVLLLWPVIERRWPGLYLAAMHFRGTRYLVDLTRCRAGFLAAVISLCLIEVML